MNHVLRVIAIATASLLSAQAVAQDQPGKNMKFLDHGKWMATLTPTHLGAFTVQKGGDANGTAPDIATLYFKCTKGGGVDSRSNSSASRQR